MTIRTTYNEYDIYYDETADLWKCNDMQMEAKTLSALKAKIRDALRADVTPLNIPALVCGSYSTDFSKVTIREMAQKASYEVNDKVWVMAPQGNKSIRKQELLENLYADDHGNRLIIEDIKSLSRQANELHRQAADLKRTMRKVTRADLGLK